MRLAFLALLLVGLAEPTAAQLDDRLSLGVTAATATLYAGDWRATGVLVPRRPTSRLPREGSPWYPLSPDVLGVPVEFTALWNGRFRRETLTAQVFAFYTPGADLWLNPALTYAVRDALNAALGLQVFAGAGDDEESLSGLLREPAPSFATYDRNDFAYLRVSYSF